MRRKQGTVLPLELAILSAAVDLAAADASRFHGFALAKHLRDAEGAKLLTAHGTLYKALARMEKAGLLVSEWEDADAAAEDRRPRRRLYEITVAGRAALARATSAARMRASTRPGLSAT